ncbi:MAG: IS701 family transposase [Thiobacillus sp.]
MERRFELRLGELLDDAVLDPRVPEGMLCRLEQFVEPFAECLASSEQRQHVWEYVGGLFSDVKRKSAEAIAYFHDQDRQALQKFIGQSPWDDRPLIGELVRQVGAELGEADGVLVFDPSAFKKQGKESVGVARQWCGRLGKIDNCQVGVYLGYISRKEHALVDARLYLNKEWANDKRRRKKCGVPREVRFRTRHALSLEMLVQHGAVLPHGWVAGDDEMGRSSAFRRDLRTLGERYLLAVPSNTLVRDLEMSPPAYGGRGRHPQVPFMRVDRWCAALPESVWTTISVRDGAKGPLLVQAVKTRVQAKTDRRRNGPEEMLVILREAQDDGTMKHDYYLSNASAETSLTEFARVAKAEHRIEECLERAKSDAGLAQFQVRNWIGWHHHQTLSLLAAWFLTQEDRRGKKIHPGAHGAGGSVDPCLPVTSRPRLRLSILHPPQHHSPSAAKRKRLCVPLEIT